jgi:cell division protein FtsQ
VSRRRRAAVVALGVAIVLVVLAGAVVVSPLLDIETVEVTGVTTDRVVEVRRAAGIDVGEPMLTLRPGSAAERVRALPWVGDVRVERDLPDTVRIAVVARVPVGWARAGTSVVVVDETGRVLWKAADAPPGIPELTGLADLASVGGNVGPRTLPAASRALGSEFRSRTASLTLLDGALVGRLVAGPEIRYGAPRAMGLKARVAAAVLASLGSARVAYVDVSVPSAPVSG